MAIEFTCCLAISGYSLRFQPRQDTICLIALENLLIRRQDQTHKENRQRNTRHYYTTNNFITQS